jgi:hypothetical protein
MRHSPVRIDAGAGDGTQPAPKVLPADAVGPLYFASESRASLASRIGAWLLLALVVLAFWVIWLTAGNPFGDDAGN